MHRPSYVVVIRDPAAVTKKEKEKEEKGGQKKKTISQLIPLKLDYHNTTVHGVKIRYNAFPFDLRFAITYHKVQGQTMNKVILFLHERTTKQLAALQWESLYVAYTRVKNANGIRVCYFGSDTSSNRTQLQHLKKLRRPELFDAWQSGYDKEGMWNGRNLAYHARQERIKLRRKLQFVTSLSQASVKTLKQWADVLDVVVPYKPGTKYRTKHEYVQAIRPIWIGLNGGVLTCEGKSKHDLTRTKKIRDPRKEKTHRCTSPASTNDLSDEAIVPPDTTPRRIFAQAPGLTARQKHCIIQATVNLKTVYDGYSSRARAKDGMKRITYCLRLDHVDECCQWTAFTLATSGEFVDDTCISYFTKHFSETVGSQAHAIDPFLLYFPHFSTHQLLRRGIANRYLERLHVRRQILLFPLNVPRGSHWVIVLVWLNAGGQLVTQCRNSMSRMRYRDAACCKRVQTFIKSLYDHTSNNVYDFPTFAPTPSFTGWTEQTPNVFACGLHVISQAYLASKGLAHTHTFSNAFVEKMREYCVYTWYRQRCTRRTSSADPLDLTTAALRFRSM